MASKKGLPAPDFSESLAFLKRWLPEGPWCLTAITKDRDKATDTETFYPASDDSAILKWLEENNTKNKSSIYFIPNPVRNRVTSKARREDIAALAGLHVDIDPRVGEDLAQEQARILALAQDPSGLPKPTAIIFSGGGYQLLWRLYPTVPITDVDHAEELKRYNVQIENQLGGDHCHDVCHLLRLVGTVNWLNEKKIKAGRNPVTAKLIEYWDERLYDLKAFIPAPEVQEPQGKPPARKKSAVVISENIRRLDSLDELGDKVSVACKAIINQGDDLDDFTRFNGDRSLAVWYVVCELVRCGIEDDIIYSIITDSTFGISAHVLDQANPTKYAIRQIGRAKQYAIDPDLMKMNDRFFVIRHIGGKAMVVEEITDPASGLSTMNVWPFGQFRNAISNKRKSMGDDKPPVPLSQWWLSHSDRREYDRIVFMPDGAPSGYYNLWHGFSVRPKPGDCKLFLDHMFENVCGENKGYYDYLIRWLARVVQHPGDPGQVAVVLKGGRGTGKSFFAKKIGHIFGRHYLGITDSRRLVGNFNEHLRNCVLLFADEAFYAGDKKNESNLKGLITEQEITIERKGCDVERQKNCLHIIMASNERWAVPAGLDDRRFFILDVSPRRRCQTIYFNAIDDQLRSGGYSALLHYLMSIDLDGFDVTDRPITKALLQEKINSMDPIHAWWFYRLMDGEIIFPGDDDGGWPKGPIPKQRIIDEVVSVTGIHRKTSIFAWTQLAEIIPPTMIDFQATERIEWVDNRGRKYSPLSQRCLILPSLSECREFWDSKYGNLAPWPEVQTISDKPPF